MTIGPGRTEPPSTVCPPPQLPFREHTVCLHGTGPAQHTVGVQAVTGEQKDRLARVQAPGSPGLACPLDTSPSWRLPGLQGRILSLVLAATFPEAFFPLGSGARSGGRWPGFTGLFPETCHLLWFIHRASLPPLTPEVRWTGKESRSCCRAHRIPELPWMDHKHLLCSLPT